MKKISFILFSLLLSTQVFSMGKDTPKGVSLLMVPAKPNMVQLGMAMAKQQHALLMTYAETSTDELFIHIWDGSKWLNVPQESFAIGSFIKNPASRLLIVGEENDLTASLIDTAMGWSQEVLHLGSTDITELLNQMGRLYGFNKNDWQWVANRYNLNLEDLNRERVTESWYDKNKASDLPPAENPWKRNSQEASVQPPVTSLTPLMPPVFEEIEEE